MIKLGTYVINGSWYVKPAEIRAKLKEYAEREYNNGIKQAHYTGYILLTNTKDKHHDFFTAYLYQRDTNRAFNVKFKITSNGLVEV